MPRKTRKQKPASRSLKLEALEPRILMTASNSDLANQFESALTQQIDSWKAQVDSYSASLLAGSFDNLLDAVDVNGNPVSNIASLQDLLKSTIKDDTKDAIDLVNAKIEGAFNVVPGDMANFSMHSVAEQLGVKQADQKTYINSISLSSGLTLETKAVVEVSGTSQTLKLALALKSGQQSFVFKALEDKLASLGVNFDNHLEVDGQATFDVGGSIEVHQVWENVTDPDTGTVTSELKEYAGGTAAITDLGANFQAELDEAASSFRLGFLKFNEIAETAANHTQADVGVRLDARTLVNGTTVTVTPTAELALDLEGTVSGTIGTISNTQEYEINKTWTSDLSQINLGSLETAFGDFRNVGANDVMAQLLKIEGWLSSLMSEAGARPGGTGTGTTAAEGISSRVLGTDIDSAATFQQTFEGKIFQGSNVSNSTTALVQADQNGSISKVLFNDLDGFAQRLNALGMLDAAGVSYDAATKRISVAIKVEGNFLNQDLPVNFTLLDGTIAKLKSNSEFEANGKGSVSFTLQIDLSSWKELESNTTLGELTAISSEQKRLQQKADEAAGGTAPAVTIADTVNDAFVSNATLRAVGGISDTGALPFSGVLSGDSSFVVKIGSVEKTLTLSQIPTATSMTQLANSLKAMLNGASLGATFDVASNLNGGLDVTSSALFSIKASDDAGAYNELRLGNVMAVAQAVAAGEVSLTTAQMNAAFDFDVTVVGGATYTVGVVAKGPQDEDGLAGLIERINAALKLSKDSNGIKTDLSDNFGIFASINSQDKIVVRANPADAGKLNQDASPVLINIGGTSAAALGFTSASGTGKFTASGAPLLGNGRLGQDVTVAFTLDGQSHSFDVDAGDSLGNNGIADLVVQIQKAITLSSAAGLISVGASGDVLYFRVIDAGTDATDFAFASNLDLAALGFTGSEIASKAELKIFHQDGSVAFIDLSGMSSGSTIDDVIDEIMDQDSNLEITIGQKSGDASKNGPSLVIHDKLTPEAGKLTGILSWNGSWLGRMLGIEGMKTITQADVDDWTDDSSSLDRVGDAIVGLDIAGVTESVIDRFSIRNFSAYAELEAEVPAHTLSSATSVATPEVAGGTTIAFASGDLSQIGSSYAGMYAKVGTARYKILKVSQGVGTDGSVNSVRLTLRDAGGIVVDSSLSVAIEGVQMTASIGPVSATLIGRTGTEGALGRALSISSVAGKSYRVSEMLKAFEESTVTFGGIKNAANATIADSMVFDVVVEGLGLTNNVGGTISLDYNADGDLLPTVTADFTPLQGIYDRLKNIDTDTILEILDQVVEGVKTLTTKENGTTIFDEEIPGIGKSVNDIIGIVDDIKQGVEDLRASGQNDLYGMVAKLRSLLGLTEQQFNVTINDLASTGTVTTPEKVLQFHLGFSKAFSEVDSFGFGTSSTIEVGGGAELYVSGSLDANFDFQVKLPSADITGADGISLRSKPELVVLAQSGVSATIKVMGDKLKFNLGLGGTGISQLSELIEVGAKDGRDSYFILSGDLTAKLAQNIAISTSSSIGGVLGNLADKTYLDPTLVANVAAELPVYVVGLYQGEIRLGEWQEPAAGQPGTGSLSLFDRNNQADKTKGLVTLDGISPTNLKVKTYADSAESDTDPAKNIADKAIVLDISEVLGNLNNLANLSNYNLFDKIKLAVDGLDIALGGIQGQLQKNFSDKALDVPVLGEALSNGADFIAEFRDSFVDPFRVFVNEASKLDAETIANYLQDLLDTIPSGGTGSILGTWDSSFQNVNRWGRTFATSPAAGKIGYLVKKDGQKTIGAEWAFHLSGEYAAGTDFGLDLGVPGLGLTTTGGVDAKIVWTLDLGFGIDDTKGFYLILPAGDELTVNASAEVDPTSTLYGSLGFLGLKAENPDIDVSLGLGLDLNNAATDVAGTLGFSRLGALKFAATATANANIGLDLTLGIANKSGTGTNVSFPDLNARFLFDWAYSSANAPDQNGIQRAGFDNVKIDLGQYVTNVLKPVAAEIKKVTDPIQPLVDFLVTPLPILRDIGVRVTPLDLAELYAKSQGKKFNSGMIKSIAKLAEVARTINSLATSIGDDGSITVGDYFFIGTDTTNDGKAKGDKDKALGFLSGNAATKKSLTGDEFALSAIGSAAWSESAVGSEFAGVLSGLEIGNDASSTQGKKDAETVGLWTFPIVQDPSQVFGLLLGKDATLVHYTMAPLEFYFEWSQFFSIVGPIGARVGVHIGADIKLAFGYDTYGIREFAANDYRNPLDLVDGFYVDDYYGGTSDVPEVKLYGGLSASAELNLGIASGGVGGGIGIDVYFDLFDPNHDGKVRLAEMWQSVKNEADYGNVLKAPLALFDVSGKIYAEFYAYLNTFWKDYRWQITDPITIVDFKVDFTRAPLMATKSGGQLLINIGSASEGRLNGNTSDGNDDVQIEIKNNGTEVLISSNAYKASNQKYTINAGDKILIDAATGKDSITIKGAGYANIEILGGTGDDNIDLSGYSALGGQILVKGQEGNDRILGSGSQASGRTYLFGDDGRLLSKSNAVIGAEALMNPDGDGIDTIIGGAGIDVIFGGGESDRIDGGAGNDYLIGDGGRYIIDQNKVDRTQLHEGGGQDVIVGGSEIDHLYGGTGNDKLDGGAGNDFLYGEKGNDIILGGSGNDEIIGGEGIDIAFGDRVVGGTLALSTVFPVLPQGIASTVKESDFVVDTRTGTVVDSATSYGWDKIEGGQGSDILLGDNGASDVAGQGKDTIVGGLDNDLITGDGGDDKLTGGVGNDTIYGGAGGDSIDGGAGDDIVFGGSGKQSLEAVAVPVGKTLVSNMASDDAKKTYGLNVGTDFGFQLDARIDGQRVETQVSTDVNDGTDTILAGQGSDFIDGQGGNDKVMVALLGGNAKGYTNVVDTGSTFQDKIVVTATLGDDTLLVRGSATGLGSVSLLPEVDGGVSIGAIAPTKSNIERVNFWKNGADTLALDAGMGDDTIAIDSTVATTSIDAGSGADTIVVGQLFKSGRTSANAASNIAADDSFDTIETTQGFLSAGPSNSTTIHGGSGNDTFVSLNNAAPVTLFGDDNDDTFTTQGFLNKVGETPVIHSPLNIDGGAGYDSFSLGGSEGPDTFYVTKEGILSSGGSANVSAVENISAFAGAGDDTFNVISTKAGTVTHLEGGLGNDTVNNGGLAVGKPLPGSTLRGYSNAIGASIESVVGADYGVGTGSELAVNVVDTSTGGDAQVLFVDATGNTIIDPVLKTSEGETGTTADNTYHVRLSKALAANETISVTISAPELSEADQANGDKGILLKSKALVGGTITLTFNSTNWSTVQDVVVMAQGGDVAGEGDALREGNQLAYLNTSVARTVADVIAPYASQVRSLSVQVTDMTSETLEGVFANGTNTVTLNGENSVDLRYALEPLSGTAITVTLAGETLKSKDDPTTSLTELRYFVDGKKILFWNKSLNRVVGVTGELVVSNYTLVAPTNTVFETKVPKSNAGSVPSVVLAPTNDSLNIVEGGTIGDKFTVMLSHELTTGQTVTVRVSPTQFDDTNSRAGLVFAATGITPEANGDLLLVFTEDNWDTGFEVVLTAGTDTAVQAGDTIYVAAQPRTLDGIDGAVYAEGNGSSEGLSLGEPVMIRYTSANVPARETNEYTDKMSATATDSITLVVAVSDVTRTLADLNAGKCAAQVFDAAGELQLRKIKSASSDGNGSLVLVLETALEGSAGNVAGIRIIDAVQSLFGDERASVDRLFVHNEQDARNSLSAITRLSTTTSPSDAAKDLANRTDAMRFTITNADGSQRIAAEGINYGDFELAEIDLGTGRDAVAVNGANSRVDGFRTVTIVNTGDESGEGDTVTVSSYIRESLLQIASGTVGAPVSVPTAVHPNGFTATGDFTATEMTGFVVEIANADGSVQRRTVMGVSYDSATNVSTISIDRAFSGTIAGAAFAIRADLRTGGYGSISAADFAQDTTTLAWTVTLPSASTATAQVGDWFEIVTEDTNGATTLVRKFVTAVSGNVLTLSGDPGATARSAATQYRIWKPTDGMLAINAQGGNDTIDATSDAITGSLIVFGGLGSDTIDVGDSAYIFGDRGQIEYSNGTDVVTRLGTTDAGSDYTTESTLKGYQTDGVNRAPTSFKTFADGVGDDDTITTGGSNSVVFGGFGEDTIQVTGQNNYVFGDGGEAKFQNLGSPVWGDSQVANPTSAKTTSDSIGGNDVIDISGGGNVVMGGGNRDSITLGGGDNIAMGDGGEAVWTNGQISRVQTTSHEIGDVDTISITGLRNKVMGGAAGDTITISGDATSIGDNVVMGDGGKAVWTNGQISLVETIEDGIGGLDTITIDGSGNKVMGGAEADTIDISGGDNVAMGDGGKAVWTNGQISLVQTTSDSIGGNDEINITGLRNKVMGGAANDTITITGDANSIGDNVAMGDGGQAVWIDGQISLVETTADAIGGLDTITIDGSGNKVMGGAEADTIVIDGGDNVAMGDGGKAVWTNGRISLVQTTSDEIGGVDSIVVDGGDNIVMGGAKADSIVVNGGDNVALGDGGRAVWIDGVLDTVSTTSDAIGGDDVIGIVGGGNVVMGGAESDDITITGDNNVVLGDGGIANWKNGRLKTVTTTSDEIGGNDEITIHGGINVVMGGNGQDLILIDGADNIALGDGGTITYRDSGVRERITTKSDSLGGNDVIRTGDGANIAFGGFANDTITTGAGADVIVGDGGFMDFDTVGEKLFLSNENQTLGGIDTIDAGIGENNVFGGLGDDSITTGINRQSVTQDQRDAWSNDKDTVLGDNGSRTFQGTGTAVDGRTSATMSFNFQGGASLGITSAQQAGATGYRTSNWINVTGTGPSTYGNDPAEIVKTDYGQRLDGLDLSWGGKEGHRTTSIECNSYILQNYDPTRIKDAQGVQQLGDGYLFAGGVRTTAPNTQSDNKLEVEMAGLSKYFKSYSVIVYLDASSEVSSLIQNPQDSTLAKQLGKTTGESIRKVNIASGAVNDSFFLDDASSSANSAYNTFNGTYVRALAKTAVAAYGKYANYVVFDGLSDDRFVVTITDGVLNVNFNGRDLPTIAGIQIVGQYWNADTIKGSTGQTGGNDSISTGGGNDMVMAGAGSDVVATFGDNRYGVNDADAVIGDNGVFTELVRTSGLAQGTTLVNARATGYDASVSLAGTTFNDVIVTGNGNDVVIGGDGQDRITTGRQDDLATGIAAASGLTQAPEALQSSTLTTLSSQDTAGLKVLSLNLSYSFRDSAKDDADLNIAAEQYAGAVAAKNWNNVQLQDELSPVQYPNPYTNTSFKLNDGTNVASGFNMNFRARDVGSTGNPTSVQVDRSNAHDQIDPDTDNANLFEGYYWAQQQQQLEVNINGIKSKAGFTTYDVYVYIDGDNERTDADNWIYECVGTNLGTGAKTTNYLNDWRGNTFNGEFRQVTAKNEDVTKIDASVIPNRALIGNYVVFRDVTAENFQVLVRNHKVGTQSPMNQPSISGIQIVGKTGVAQNQKNLPLNGDYDKDVVLGDNGKVNLTLDVPFGYDASPDRALNPVQNKAYEAVSDTATFVAGNAASQSDWISTGRNQDLVLGGNGSDSIDAGLGNDVVMGDNGQIQMVDFNPIGVRQPLNLKILDLQTADNTVYIGKPGFNNGQFVQKITGNQIAGVKTISSTTAGNDIVDAGKDNDLVYGQEGNDLLLGNSGTDDVLYDTTGTNQIKDTNYPTEAAFNADLTNILSMLDANATLVKNEFVKNDFFKASTLGVLAQGFGTPTTPPVSTGIDLSSLQDVVVTLTAGQEVVLTSTNWPGKGGTPVNVELAFSSNGTMIPALQVSWLVNGATQTSSINPNQWWARSYGIPDAPNNNGVYTLKVKATTAGSFKVRLTNF